MVTHFLVRHLRPRDGRILLGLIVSHNLLRALAFLPQGFSTNKQAALYARQSRSELIVQ